MVSGAGRRAVVAAAVLAAGAAGATVIAHADGPRASATQATGGLSVSPVRVDRRAAAGAANVMTVANRSKDTLSVAVRARPWKQSQAGPVSPNRRSTLKGVTVSTGSFSLAPGATKQVTVTLAGVPASGSLYGALEVVGVPANLASRKGIVTGYRLVGPLRYTPATPRYGLKAGAAKVTSAKTLAVVVTNTGNAAEPVSGDARVKGPLGTRQGSVRSVRILPGKSVALAFLSARGLTPGRYTATLTLKQGSSRTTITKRIRVKR